MGYIGFFKSLHGFGACGWRTVLHAKEAVPKRPVTGGALLLAALSLARLKKTENLVAASHRIFVAEVDQRLGVGLLE